MSLLVLSLNAGAVTDDEFKNCVAYKDIVAAIVARANEGFTRQEIKAKVSDGAGEVVDWVFDFKGVYSDQELIKRAMAICLNEFNQRPSKKNGR